MDLNSEVFICVLKDYLKGKNDNIYFILLSLKDLIIEKCVKYKINNKNILEIIFITIHGVSTYSFEKNLSFYNYMNMYLDVSLTEYNKLECVVNTLLNNDFFDAYVECIKDNISFEKVIEK